jgi:hypothetical protein
MPSEPFQVEVYAAAGAIVRFTMTEESIRRHRLLGVSSADKERDALWAAAVRWLEFMFDPEKATDPVRIIDDDGAFWIIPPGAVLAVRLFDPTSATLPKRVGFLVSGGELSGRA